MLRSLNFFGQNKKKEIKDERGNRILDEDIIITHYRWKKGTIKVIIGGIRIQISSINARNIELLRGNCGACALQTALHIYIRQIAAICEPCKPNCKKGLMKRLSRVFRFSLHVHLVLDE